MIVIGFLGSILYYAALIIFMVSYTPVCFIVWVVSTPFDKDRRLSAKMNTMVGYMIMFLNPFWRMKIHGLKDVDQSQTYIYAPNHQALTDIAMLSSTAIQLKWISKKELTYVPLLGWMMGMAKYVLLDRKDPKSQFKMMKSCEHFLMNGLSIAIFPEGTRSKTEEMGRFRDGAALLARKTKTSILPVCVVGNSLAMPNLGIFWTRKVVMNMYFLKPISPLDYDKTKELSNAIKQAIYEKQVELKVFS